MSRFLLGTVLGFFLSLPAAWVLMHLFYAYLNDEGIVE